MSTFLSRTAVFLSLAFFSASALAQQQPVQELVRPSQANPAVQQFDETNVVLTPPNVSPSAPLALFLPGTGGRPLNAIGLLNVVAAQGYRVIGLMYNDTPAASQICPRDPDPQCFAGFHSMRVFAKGPATVSNSYAESIEGRLVSLLRYLDHEHPQDGWAAYLTPEGRPRWSNILVSGLSQGAGMSAWIAQTVPVYRVVLFSSPWDNMGRGHRPAPWLFRSSATPMDRWWAERHVRENTTEYLANAYRALRIPPQHILLFDQGLAPQQKSQGENPYHPSTILNPAYQPQWQQMYGSAATP